MENTRNRDPLSRSSTSRQTTMRPIESRGIPSSESSTSSAKLSSRFYFPASSKRISVGPGGGGAHCCRITNFERGRKDNQSSSLPRDETEQSTSEHSPAEEVLPRMRPNAAIVVRRGRPTCSCFLRRRCDKATETLTSAVIETTEDFARARVSQKPSPAASVPKKTFDRCYAQRGNTTNKPESMIQFYKTHDKAESQDSTALAASGLDCTTKKLPSNVFGKDLTPKEIMNTWVPGNERPVEGLFTPSENYIDVSTRDFSLRKYFPEMFLSETEKNEIKAKERAESLERDAAAQKNYCKTQKCPQGKCNSEKDEESDQDWRTIIELGSEIRTPCPWSDEGIRLTPAQEEVTEEESDVNSMPEKRTRGWHWWSCGKSKREKKTEKKKHDRKQD